MTVRPDWDKARRTDRVKNRGSERASRQVFLPIDWAARRKRSGRVTPRDELGEHPATALRGTKTAALTQGQRNRLQRLGLHSRDQFLTRAQADFVLDLLEPIGVDTVRINRVYALDDRAQRRRELTALRTALNQGLVECQARLARATGTLDGRFLARARGLVGRSVMALSRRLPPA